MKVAPTAVGIACVIPRATHTKLVAQAETLGVAPAQYLCDLVVGAVRRADRSSDKAISEVSAALQWQEAYERTNDDVAALRRRLAEMETAERGLRDEIAHLTVRAEAVTPPGPMPQVRGHRDMIDRGRDEAPRTDAELLTPAFVKSCFGFRSVGNSPAEIAKLMCCPIAQVRRALETKR